MRTPDSPEVLIIDDDPLIVRTIARIFGTERVLVSASDAEAGLAILHKNDIAVVLVDVVLPGMTGLQFLELARGVRPDVEVIVMTGGASIQSAVQAMRLGAYDYIEKPFESVDRLRNIVSRAVERHTLRRRNIELEKLVGQREGMPGIIGTSAAMLPIFELIGTVAETPVTVLITGESGTGKELVAKSIHALSPRKGKPFVAINCSAFPETLLDSELFGHAKGAFTGATARRAGVFEAANGGSLFLDEVGDISLGTQVRLLRVLQDGELRRVGEATPITVDTRVIAATNVDLKAAVSSGQIREDFFYRLNVVTIHLPPLRDRVTDIPALVDHFVAKHAARMGRTISGVNPDAVALLCQHRWPGNIRELENVIARAVVLTKGPTIEVAALPLSMLPFNDATDLDPVLARLSFSDAKRSAIEVFERRYLQTKLTAAGGNITKAAEQAGLDRSNFRRLLKAHGLDSASDDKASADEGRDA